ncbi:hypothetical protein [Streptomyces lavendofoliae]|uniref:hypothetical protein n=1 Tax=Streptomyces lavendofoliae TaxID=67314 RepID=UPI003D8E5CC0
MRNDQAPVWGVQSTRPPLTMASASAAQVIICTESSARWFMTARSSRPSPVSNSMIGDRPEPSS